MDKRNAGKEQFILWKASDTVLNVSTVIGLAIILILMTLQIVMRYVFNNPLKWTDELSRMSMVWMTFLGSVVAFREKAHICVDLITSHFPRRLNRIVALMTDLICIGFLCVLIVMGIKYVQMNINTVSLVTGISKGRTYMIIPISSAWMIIYIVRNMVERYKGDK
ncbi:MAG: TRAP transporter small permease [Roseburia sp.]|nr:TRAP transporter small permease [Roseburia sp.]